MNKNVLFIFLIITNLNIFSQDNNCDYIIKEKDTIFGKLRNGNGFTDNNGKKHSLKKVRTLNFQDIIFVKENIKINSIFLKKHSLNKYIISTIDNYYGIIYTLKLRQGSLVSTTKKHFINKQLRKTDFIINIEKDTIYGKIHLAKNTFFKAFLKTNNNEKIKISPKYVISYRFENKIYNLNKLKIENGLKSPPEYLNIILNGKLKLLNYLHLEAQSEYQSKYIELNNKLYHINSDRFLKTMYFIFENNKEFSKRIRKREFNYANLYHFVKTYNLKNNKEQTQTN